MDINILKHFQTKWKKDRTNWHMERAHVIIMCSKTGWRTNERVKKTSKYFTDYK